MMNEESKNKKMLSDESEGKKMLSDEELDSVAGGMRAAESVPIRFDAKGNPTHYQMYAWGKPMKDQIWHFECPRCGRLLHRGLFGRMYCDPCDEGWTAFLLKMVDGFYPGCE